MRILWISNILLPDIAAEIGEQVPFAGGWMNSSLQAILKENKNIRFSVLSFLPNINTVVCKSINSIDYYLLPEYDGSKSTIFKELCQYVANQIKPDIVHIHGTEIPNGYYFYEANPYLKYVISIQGLLSVYHRYYLSGIDLNVIKRFSSIYQWIKKKSIFDGQASYKIKASIEKKYLESIPNIIGRTDWDDAHSWAVNNKRNYYFCNETLRSAFYSGRWAYNKCIKHSIFVSQAKNPIKGFHILLESLPLVLREFPDTKVVVASSLNLFPQTWKDRIKMNDYAKYLRQIVERHNLWEHLILYNGLSEKEMVDEYLKCNVFVSPSAIENSPNSVGEAQLLGVPVISSICGGVMNMVKDNYNGFLYRFDEPELLAGKICQCFHNNFDYKILDQAVKDASLRHDKVLNAKTMIEIYEAIISEDELLAK